MSAEEDELLLAAVLGDPDAIEELLDTHGQALRRSLEGRIDAQLRTHLNEDDVLQETYLDAFTAIRRFRPNGIASFVAWLSKLADRNLVDGVRELQALKNGGGKRRVFNVEAHPDDSYVDLLDGLGGSVTSPTRDAARSEAKILLTTAMQRLPESYKLVVKLFDLEGGSPEHVAETCKCSVGAMYMRRSRALEMLRQILGGESLY